MINYIALLLDAQERENYKAQSFSMNMSERGDVLCCLVEAQIMFRKISNVKRKKKSVTIKGKS